MSFRARHAGLSTCWGVVVWRKLPCWCDGSGENEQTWVDPIEQEWLNKVKKKNYGLQDTISDFHPVLTRLVNGLYGITPFGFVLGNRNVCAHEKKGHTSTDTHTLVFFSLQGNSYDDRSFVYCSFVTHCKIGLPITCSGAEDTANMHLFCVFVSKVDFLSFVILLLSISSLSHSTNYFVNCVILI